MCVHGLSAVSEWAIIVKKAIPCSRDVYRGMCGGLCVETRPVRWVSLARSEMGRMHARLQAALGSTGVTWTCPAPDSSERPG